MSTTDPPTTLVRLPKEREKHLTALEANLSEIRTAPSVLELELGRMERKARKRIEEFSTMMQRNPLEVHKTLEILVTGPLLFTPIETSAGKCYRIEGELALKSLFVAETTISGGVPMASPAGTETLPEWNFAWVPVRIEVWAGRG